MSIASLVAELAVQTTDGDHYGPSLLQQLWSARSGSIGSSTPGATASNERAAFNVKAHDKWYEVVELTGLMYSGATGNQGSQNPMLNLTSWLPIFLSDVENGDATSTQQETALNRLMQFADGIINLLQPPKSGPLHGVGCPNCGLWRVVTGEGEEAGEGPALRWSLPAGEDLTASCMNPACVDRITGERSTWVGDTAVIQLGRLSGQDIDVDLIRESRYVDQPEYEPGEKVTITPEHPEYQAIVTQMRGGAA